MTDTTDKPRIVFGEPIPWKLLSEVDPGGCCSRCLHRLPLGVSRCAYCGLDTRTDQEREDDAGRYIRRSR